MSRNSNQLKLNSYSFHKNTSALSQIIKFTNNIGMTYVIPSQGDLHDMNIFQNGYVVDFEAAGWNRLSTDVATFLHHIMAGSNYFGPKYAKWAETMNVLPSEQVNNTGNGSAHVVLNTMRKNLIKDYMHYYIDQLDPSIISRLDQEFSYMLAFRLLTVYDVTNMTQEDQDIVFILVNYFISDETLDEKLARFVA
jgi:thiamine kinase-like enzyme